MPRMHAQSPEGHRPQFIGGICGRVLDDAIAGSDVMEQKIAIWVNDLVAKGLRYCECSAIDGDSRRSRDDGADVAGGATDVFKDLFARLCTRPLQPQPRRVGGTFVPRINCAKWSISARPRLSGTSSGSGVILPIVVTSLGRRRFVTPISFR